MQHCHFPETSQLKVGFTLIELSIVLVIIGLIVGGVLAGQDLVRAAGERAQISQIEKFNVAVNTFRGKYGEIPGDMDTTTATMYGFSPSIKFSGQVRNPNGNAGESDGNGIIEGTSSFASPTANCGNCIGAGEPVTFWDDLTYANGMNLNLVEGIYDVDNNCPWACGNIPNYNGAAITGTLVGLFFPSAKIGGANWVYVYSKNNINYYGLSPISSIAYQVATAQPGLSVKQAYDIDQKIDDGFPQSGNVIAQYINTTVVWAAGGGANGASPGSTTSSSSTTCYDNGGNGGIEQYSITQNNGSGTNCALSFKFQ